MYTFSSATALLLVITSIITPTLSLPVPASTIFDIRPTLLQSQTDNQRRHLHLIGSTDGRPLHTTPQQTWDAPLPVIPSPSPSDTEDFISRQQRHTADEVRNWLVKTPDAWSTLRRTQAPPPSSAPQAHSHYQVMVESVPVYSYQDFQRHGHVLLVSLRSVTEHLAVAAAVAFMVTVSLLFAAERLWKRKVGRKTIHEQVLQEKALQ